MPYSILFLRYINSRIRHPTKSLQRNLDEDKFLGIYGKGRFIYIPTDAEYEKDIIHEV